MAGDSLPNLDLEKLAQNLATGFEALIEEVKNLAKREASLRKSLEVARKDHNQISPSSSSEEEPLDLPSTERDVPAPAPVNGSLKYPHETLNIMATVSIREAIDACKMIKKKASRTADINSQRCPISHKSDYHEDLEHDFTTQGVQGNLQCPFARMAANGQQPVLINGKVDPIAAEFHPDQVSIHTDPRSAQAPDKCPIRFLDQHSPEEIARYFENHKHEIPRSHEICVKRYQQNEQSIRQLDAKYGNLVNMIQGLGVKHKQYLPGDAQNELLRKEQGSVEAVEKWADGLSHKSLDPIPEQHPQEEGIPKEEERKPHFERSLREVRVGESPSRPWGISVPAAQKPSQSAILSGRGSEPVDLARSELTIPKLVKDEPARKCPVDHGLHSAMPNVAGLQTVRDDPGTKAGGNDTSIQPHIVFKGPVFFGYSAEQVAAFLQSANLGNQHA